MDNSPRNPYLKNGGCGIDISCEMALFARNLADIDKALGKQAEAGSFASEANKLSGTINHRM